MKTFIVIILFLFAIHFFFIYYKEPSLKKAIQWYATRVKKLLSAREEKNSVPSNDLTDKAVLEEHAAIQRENIESFLKPSDNIRDIFLNYPALPEYLEKQIDNEEIIVDSFPVPLKLFRYLSIEEKHLRLLIANLIIKQKGLTYKEEGTQKAILPLEVMLFLNKETNPLANENGEITITIDEKDTNFLNLKKAFYKYATKQNLNDKDKQSDINSLMRIIGLVEENCYSITELADFLENNINDVNKENTETKSVTKKKRATKKAEPKVEQYEEEIEENDTRQVVGVDDVTGEVFYAEAQEEQHSDPYDYDEGDVGMFPDSVEEQSPTPPIEPENTSTQEDVVTASEQSSPPQQTDEQEQITQPQKEDTKQDETTSDDEQSFPDLFSNLEIESEINSLPSEEASSENKYEDKTVKEFIISLPWANKNLDTSMINFAKIDTFINTLFESESDRNKLLRNIIKQQPLVFSSNKEQVFVDSKIIIFAISKFFGTEAKTAYSILMRMVDRGTALGSPYAMIKETFTENFIEYIIPKENLSDSWAPFYVKNTKTNSIFLGYGLEFSTNSLKGAFYDCQNNSFDLFRANNLNSELKITTREATSSNKKIPELASGDFGSTQIL